MMTLRHLFFCILCLAFFLVMVPPASAVQPPVAEFDSFGCIGEPPRSVVFLYHYSYGGGLPETWYWDFGDGASSDESSPLHIYSEAGIYDVCLTVENSAGSDTITKTGHVIATPYFPPRAAFTIIPMSDALPDPNSYPPAYFDGAAPCEIRVSDASLGNPIAWEWDFGDGTTSTDRYPPLHLYPVPGIYPVSLTVANANGTDTLAMSDFVRVVEGLAPEVHFGTRELAFERMGAPPLEISFRDYSRFSPTAWLWDFGDGATSTQQHPVHTYTEYGNFTVGLTVSNDYGSDTATAEHYIAVGDSFPPIAHPGYSPADGFAPLTVAFEDRSWWEPTSWLWDFGDGATSTEQHPVHTYTEPGSYHIDLTVSNALGSDSLDGGYLVSVRDPSLLERPPEADFSYDADLNALRFRDRSGWYPTAWHWDFGDGATSAEQHPVHVYTGPGMYTVTLIAENAYGPGTASKAIRLVSLELLSEIPVITPGEMATVDIVMDVAPAGLSGYNLTVAIEDPERATVTAIAYPSWGLMHKNGPLPASETFLSAADLEESVVPGSREITLATIALEARTEGTANLTVAAARLDDDEGLPVYACVLPARIGVRPLLAVPNSALPPQDLDGDGLCEDINGNGRADFDDVVVFYRSMGWIADNEPTGAFDYNKNGRIDFQDLVLLYRSV